MNEYFVEQKNEKLKAEITPQLKRYLREYSIGCTVMTDVAGGTKEVLDRSILASLRELQEDGEPDIVAEVGDLFINHAVPLAKDFEAPAQRFMGSSIWI